MQFRKKMCIIFLTINLKINDIVLSTKILMIYNLNNNLYTNTDELKVREVTDSRNVHNAQIFE